MNAINKELILDELMRLQSIFDWYGLHDYTEMMKLHEHKSIPIERSSLFPIYVWCLVLNKVLVDPKPMSLFKGFEKDWSDNQNYLLLLKDIKTWVSGPADIRLSDKIRYDKKFCIKIMSSTFFQKIGPIDWSFVSKEYNSKKNSKTWYEDWEHLRMTNFLSIVMAPRFMGIPLYTTNE